jgi:hypothetical protein
LTFEECGVLFAGRAGEPYGIVGADSIYRESRLALAAAKAGIDDVFEPISRGGTAPAEIGRTKSSANLVTATRQHQPQPASGSGAP